MKQDIAICCITDRTKGFGNLSRCVTLAEEMRRKGYKITFIINHNNVAEKELQRRKFIHVSIPKFTSRSNYSSLISKTLNHKKYELVIIDAREYGELLSKNLKVKNFKIVLLDDAWGRNAYADMIFNGTMIEQYHKYKKINKKCRMFLGTKYWIISKEFSTHKKKLHEIHPKKKYSIVVSMGGADVTELTLLVIRSLLDISNIKITVIVGPFFKNLMKLHALIRNKKNVTVVYSPKKIWKEFLKADAAIASSGNTLFELAIQRIPTICIAAVPHQVPYAKTFAAKGFTIDLGFWKNVKKERIRKTLVQLIMGEEKRRKMCLAGNKIIDGKGLSRVVQVLEGIVRY